jgi:single-stranded DNA-binding protein
MLYPRILWNKQTTKKKEWYIMNTVVIDNARIAKDPETRFTTNGQQVTDVFVVESRNVNKDKDGEPEWQSTLWNVVEWGDGELVKGAKGDRVNLTGYLEGSEYEDKEGNKKYSAKLIVKSAKVFPPQDKSDGKKSSSKVQSQVDTSEEPF